jgi:hypothetical protein
LQDDDMPAKLHAVKLVYDDNGRELYEPVKEVTKQENISYMAELYSRCQVSNTLAAAASAFCSGFDAIASRWHPEVR